MGTTNIERSEGNLQIYLLFLYHKTKYSKKNFYVQI